MVWWLFSRKEPVPQETAEEKSARERAERTAEAWRLLQREAPIRPQDIPVLEALVKAGVEIAPPELEKKSLLFHAIRLRQLPLVEMLYQQSREYYPGPAKEGSPWVRPPSVEEMYKACREQAVEQGYVPVLRYLQAQGEPVLEQRMWTHREFVSVPVYAAMTGRRELLEWCLEDECRSIIEKAVYRKKQPVFSKALEAALQAGEIGLATMLHEKNTRLNKENLRSVLEHAVQKRNQQIGVLEWLVAHEYNVLQDNIHENAFFSGSQQVIAWFKARGTYDTYSNKQRSACFLSAIEGTDIAFLAWLEEEGFLLSRKNEKHQRQAVKNAVCSGSLEKLQWLVAQAGLPLPLLMQAEPDLLLGALRVRAEEPLLDFLLAHGYHPDVPSPREEYQTPLHTLLDRIDDIWAGSYVHPGYAEQIVWLLQQGANIHAQDKQGRSLYKEMEEERGFSRPWEIRQYIERAQADYSAFLEGHYIPQCQKDWLRLASVMPTRDPVLLEIRLLLLQSHQRAENLSQLRGNADPAQGWRP